MNLQSVIFTLQYCLESFEGCCQCGVCDPCTRGQENIKAAIHLLENLTAVSRGSASSVLYVLERKGTRIEFADRSALLEFVRGLVSPALVLNDDATDVDIAVMVAGHNWTLIGYDTGQYLQLTTLLETAVQTIHELLLTTELNMDDLEAATIQEIEKAAAFQHLLSLNGFRAEVNAHMSSSIHTTEGTCANTRSQ